MKKRNLASKIMTGGLAAAMVLSMGVPVWAAPKNSDGTLKDGDHIGASATISKTLTTAKTGVTLPTGNFTFSVTSSDDNAPEVSTAPSATISGTQDANGQVTFSTSGIFANVSLTNTPVGTYTYTVKENEGLSGTGATTLDADHTVKYDKSEYEVQIQVTNDSGTKKISDIVAYKTKDSDGNPIEETSQTKTTTISFSNKYREYANDDPTNPDNPGTDEDDSSKGLIISKTIDSKGTGVNTSDEFTYTISFTKDDVNDDLALTAGTAVKDGTSDVTTLDYNKDYKFTLGDGDSITFKIPAGTGYTVTEDTTGSVSGYTYTASSVTTTNGVKSNEAGSASVSSTAGEKLNKVEYTNTRTANPLTGIVNNYGGLIAVVAIAAGGMVILTLRRRREDV